MQEAQPLYDLGPAASLALMGLVLAGGPLAWVWLRHRVALPAARLRALALVTLFLTFDLVLFGAFTRLTDSGLGCPDWPGCYGAASPLGAQPQIDASQSVLPSGAVTHRKAWIEMTHRYLATGVGVLILALALMSWIEYRRRRGDRAPAWWSIATLVWVCVQGAFGALTVTMKLYPAIVTAHLLGAMVLLALLAAQAETYRRTSLHVPTRLHRAVCFVGALAIVQIALGGWVSTNYAVLACNDFPLCNGSWWPAMDFQQGFTLRRELGQASGGDWLAFAALTAIHYTHRIFACVVLVAMAWLAMQLHRQSYSAEAPSLRRWAWAIGALALWQLASGMSNVILGWPLLAAMAHTAGAAALIVVLTMLIMRLQGARRQVGSAAMLGNPVQAAS
jgi:cytochrome c oxidase assembly protein subunit 15